MTKSWWSGEPGEHLLDVAIVDDDDLDAQNNEDESEPEGLLSNVPWWIVAIVVAVLVAFAGAIIWLVYNAANDCHKSTVGCFQPNR